MTGCFLLGECRRDCSANNEPYMSYALKLEISSVPISPCRSLLGRIRQQNSTYRGRSTRWACLAVHKPYLVPRGTLQRMRRRWQARVAVDVQAAVEAGNILEEARGETSHPSAPQKVTWDKYSDFWNTFCVVWHTLNDGDNFCRCTCWLWSWSGHCSHSYAPEEHWGLHIRVPPVIPNAAQAADDVQYSDDEGPARRRRRPA